MYFIYQAGWRKPFVGAKPGLAESGCHMTGRAEDLPTPLAGSTVVPYRHPHINALRALLSVSRLYPIACFTSFT